MAAKLLNSGEESSIVSKQDRSIRVFTENLWGKKKETTQEGHPKEKINFIFQEIEEKTAKAVIEN